MVGAPGFEPGTSCAQGKRATKLRHAPKRRASPFCQALLGVSRAIRENHTSAVRKRRTLPPLTASHLRKGVQSEMIGVVTAQALHWVGQIVTGALLVHRCVRCGQSQRSGTGRA